MKKLYTFVFTLFVSCGAWGQWQLTTGVTGAMFGLTTNGATVYASSNGGGVYKSTDNGASFTQTNTGLLSTNAYCVLVSAGNCFVGTAYGIYKSSNEGASWSSSGSGLDGSYNATPNIVVDGSVMYAATTYSLYKSTDQGASWSNMGINKPVRAILVDGTTIYAGTDYYGMYVSTNSGSTWTSMSSGFSGAVGTYKSIYSIVKLGSTVFAAASGDGIYQSSNGGTSWTKVSSSLTSQSVRSLLVVGTTLFAAISDGKGLYCSVDNGLTWVQINEGIDQFYYSYPYFYNLAVNGDYLFASSDSKVFRRPLTELVSAIASVHEYSGLQLYPNPVKDKAVLEVPSNYIHKNYMLYDISSRLVMQGQVESSKILLDLGRLSQGVYSLCIDNQSIKVLKE